MKKYLTLLLIGVIPLLVFSQATNNAYWTWVKGDSIRLAKGIYGIKGVATDENKPGPRKDGLAWKDTQGNLWLYGGVTPYLSYPQYSDLWKFNPNTRQWTWINGDSTSGVKPSYGMQGVEDSLNKPGARYNGTAWTDHNGNFWLFGGYAIGVRNDLWKYNPETNLWTWVKGDSITQQVSVYGTKGIAADGNKPGARYGSISWVDASGNLWLFGGRGYAGSWSLTNMGDLWKYNITTNQWTWYGSGETAVYGIKGEPSATNTPGGRYGSLSWVDPGGNFWLYGGERYSSISLYFSSFNDLWKYNTSTNQWVWMHGDNTRDNKGIYGTKGVANPNNKPGGRVYAASWADQVGNLWMFGGKQLYIPKGYSRDINYLFNDLWQFNIASNQWTWHRGDSIAFGEGIHGYGIYGEQNIGDANTNPGARSNTSAWFDNAGDLWLFGGEGYATIGSYGDLNDLWKFNDISILPVNFLSIAAILQKSTVQVSWKTVSEINTFHYVVERSTNGSTFSPLGTVAASKHEATIKEYTFYDLHPDKGMNYYRIKGVDYDGKTSYSKVAKVKLYDLKENILIYPNPVKTMATIQYNSPQKGTLRLSLSNNIGQQVYSQQIPLIAGANTFSIDLSELSKGLYFATLQFGSDTKHVKIIKD
jgi:hypothetical protein